MEDKMNGHRRQHGTPSKTKKVKEKLEDAKDYFKRKLKKKEKQK